MFLSSDAESCSRVNNNALEGKIDKDILRQIEDDLDIDEKISILFLMINDYSHGFREIYDLLQKREGNSYILEEFIDGHPRNWKSKLLEALCVIQNRQIIRKLGINFSDLEVLYLPKTRLCSRNLNSVMKCLYLLCEALTETDKNLLVQYVKSDFLIENESRLKDTDYLELHILYWLEQKHILIQSDGKVNLKNLLKHVKRFEALELVYEDLKKHEDHQNVLDFRNASLNVSQLAAFSSTEGVSLETNVKEEYAKKLKKGLCIIISQMFFSGQKLDIRFGTSADRDKLSETFKSFGFTVTILNNLKKDEMLQKLEDIPKEFGTDYDCIFVCILSHGFKGGIICSDEKEVSIESIEHQICCEELKDVIKVVIIQACQGDVKGQVNNDLTTDGPSTCNTSNILAYRNFCIFMSTMQGFVSVRHKVEGSWFIQEFCNVLRNEGHKITFLHAAMKIIQSVTKKKGKLDGTNSIGQLPELRSCRLLTDFWLPVSQAYTS